MVREVLDTALEDLHQYGFTLGDNADAQGARPTDGKKYLVNMCF